MDQELEDTQNKSDTRNEILLATLKLFSEKGYFNTSLTDIKEAAGLKSTSAIYLHFKNKQAIANTLNTNILDSLNSSVDEIRRRNRKAEIQLREIMDLLFVLTNEAPEIIKFLLIMNISEFLPDAKPVVQTPPFVKILKIIQSGIKAGEIRAMDPLLAYSRFFGVVNQTLCLVLTGDLDQKVDAYQAGTWLTAWNVLAKQ